MNIKNVERPWGFFRQFTENELSTVKLHNINAGQSLSLQYHTKRDEFWVILSGNPKITFGDKIIFAKTEEEFFIPKKTIHGIEALSEDVQVLEISFGDFAEDDIVRIKDKYSRASTPVPNEPEDKK